MEHNLENISDSSLGPEERRSSIRGEIREVFQVISVYSNFLLRPASFEYSGTCFHTIVRHHTCCILKRVILGITL